MGSLITILLHFVLPAAIGVFSLMLVLWLIGIKNDNYAIVDFGWAAGLALTALIYAWVSRGYMPRNILFAAMAAIWGLRLGLYLLLTRVIGKPEEGRYQQLRKEWGGNLKMKFLAFFEFQALLDLFLSIPFLAAALNPRPEISVLEWAGVALWTVAMSGEAVADAQLNRFKKDPANRGKTCRAGLWNYSRHPNYFFEWLIWMAWFTFALGSRHGWVSILCPAVMLYFLFKVTGIPATEAQALRSRGEDYRRYQETTSAFVPWFKKKIAN